MMKCLVKIGIKNRHRLTVTICFFMVCIGTQQIQTVAWNTGLIEAFRSLTGVLMALVMLSGYRWQSFAAHMWPYIVWSISGTALSIMLVPIALIRRLDFLAADTVIIALAILLLGYCVIHTVIDLFVERNLPLLYRPLFVLWMVMMLWMIFSRSDYLWPECYFVIFLCYYLTAQTAENRRAATWGMVDGIILGFMAIQAHSLLCRPYDRVRYYGNFCNQNHNAMFLCLCLSAILAKILYVTRQEGKQFVKCLYFLLVGTCYSFICMTVCRSAYIAVFIVTILFLAAYCRFSERKVFLKTGVLLVLIFMVSFPTTYLAVRYIPTVHPHVLFYYQEGYSEDRVHSWDPRDSEKYVSFIQLLQTILNRFSPTQTVYEEMINPEAGMETDTRLLAVSSHMGSSLRNLLCTAKADNAAKSDRSDEDAILRRQPALTQEESQSSFVVRYTIYKWYFDHLTLRGMPYDEQGFQLTERHWIQDTHNIYLDYGINFGWPAMILFAIFIWWGIGRLTICVWRKRDAEKMGCLLIAIVPPVFGLFEFSWGTGLLSTVAFYYSFKEMLT